MDEESVRRLVYFALSMTFSANMKLMPFTQVRKSMLEAGFRTSVNLLLQGMGDFDVDQENAHKFYAPYSAITSIILKEEGRLVCLTARSQLLGYNVEITDMPLTNLKDESDFYKWVGIAPAHPLQVSK